jgi:hypothetical protein
MSEGRSIPAWAIPTALGVLVVGLVIISLVRGPVEMDPDSPEGAVQQYLLAVDDRRWEDALEVFHPQWRGSCTADDLVGYHVDDFTAQLGQGDSGMFGSRGMVDTFEQVGGEIEEQPLPGGTEFIDVTITHTDAFGSTWDEWVQFELVDDDDFWWIVGDPWPYFVWNCR